MPKPIYLTFHGKRWKLVFKDRMKDYGQADEPTKIGKEIRLRAKQTDFDLLDSVIHEALHCCGFDILDEEWVARSATDISKALWKLGYRRVGPKPAASEPPKGTDD